MEPKKSRFPAGIAPKKAPLAQLEKDYPEFWHGRILPCPCTFVNMADITDEDCLACEDVATGMGLISMKYAYNEKKIAEILPKFKAGLRSMDAEDNTCLLEKIRLYFKKPLRLGNGNASVSAALGLKGFDRVFRGESPQGV